MIRKESYENCLAEARHCKASLEECFNAQLQAMLLCDMECGGIRDVSAANDLLRHAKNLHQAMEDMDKMIKDVQEFVENWPV